METGKDTFQRQKTAVHGLFVGNYVSDYQSQFLAEMSQWISAGKVKYKEDLWSGLEQTPRAFRAMLEGGNFGKTLIRVGDDPTLDAPVTRQRMARDVLSGIQSG